MKLPLWQIMEETASGQIWKETANLENMGGHCHFGKYGRKRLFLKIWEDTSSLANIDNQAWLRYEYIIWDLQLDDTTRMKQNRFVNKSKNSIKGACLLSKNQQSRVVYINCEKYNLN